MLVLSRRESEKILFPNIRTTIHILRSQKGLVRVGIDAPKHIKILRHEIENNTLPEADESPPGIDTLLNHRQRNRLNEVALALHLCQQYLQADQAAAGEAALERALNVLKKLDQELDTLAGDPPPTPPLRALVVDDEPNERELLAGVLRMNGCQVESAKDGCDALEYLSTHICPDVLLLDIRMPRCDGYEMLNRIRKDSRYDRVRVFVISGTAPRTDPQTPAARKLFDGWFTKPLDPKRLWEEMRANSNKVAAITN